MKKKTVLFIVAIIFTSVCLRGPMTSVGSLADLIQSDMGVSAGALGFVTTLPLLVFAATSLFIPAVANRIGHTRILVVGMFILVAGCYVRSLSGYLTILLGTLLVGIGVSVGNVLISAVIKENMPLMIGLTTGVYLCFQNLAATSGAAFSHPVSETLMWGWRNTLMFWVLPGILAGLSWMVYGISNKTVDCEIPLKHEVSDTGRTSPLWTSKLAWSITIVMGAQSMCYYGITAWLPSILDASNMDFETAGYIASAFQLFALPAVFAAPIIITRTKNKTMPAVLSGVMYIIGILILMSAKDIPVILAGLFVLAFGGGASFAWVVAIIAIVSRDGAEAVRLSGMVQSIGYLMAAVSPTLAGVLFDISGSWIPVTIMVIIMSLMIIIFSRLPKGNNSFQI